MEFITTNWQTILLIITGVMALASQVAALTPSKKDDEAIGWLQKIFNVIAGNWGNAKNAK